MVKVCGPRDKRRPEAINTTSRSKNWSRGLSPFVLGPIECCAGIMARNVENAWQYSKVYKCHTKEDGSPSLDYFKWAKAGWLDPMAHRYPMGKGVIPEYSYWNGKKLTYVQARKEIYVPLYSKAVADTPAFAKLKDLYEEQEELWLWDFDGYDHRKLGMDLNEVLDCAEKKMGHAFVLAMMLEGYL